MHWHRNYSCPSPIPEMEEDFSTIEHDFLHMKDCFNNYKFAYKERKSKLDFFQNIGGAAVRESSGLIALAKQQLVEAKNVYKRLDGELKVLSQELYEAEIRCSEQRAAIESLEEQESQLHGELDRLMKLEEQMKISEDMNAELDKIEEEIKWTYGQIEAGKPAQLQAEFDERKKEEAKLYEIKQGIAEKQRRLTIVTIDSYIEDLYIWHQRVAALLEAVFGKIETEQSENGCIIRITTGDAQLVALVQDRKLREAKLVGSSDESKQAKLEAQANYAYSYNDLSYLAANVLYDC